MILPNLKKRFNVENKSNNNIFSKLRDTKKISQNYN